MPKPDSDDGIAVALTPGMMMKARRSLIALLLCRSDALSTTAGPPRSLFLAKPTVPAKALVEFSHLFVSQEQDKKEQTALDRNDKHGTGEYIAEQIQGLIVTLLPC